MLFVLFDRNNVELPHSLLYLVWNNMSTVLLPERAGVLPFLSIIFYIEMSHHLTASEHPLGMKGLSCLEINVKKQDLKFSLDGQARRAGGVLDMGSLRGRRNFAPERLK